MLNVQIVVLQSNWTMKELMDFVPTVAAKSKFRKLSTLLELTNLATYRIF